MNWEMLFFVGCMWIFLPIVYFTMRNNTVCKKNLILSVTLPPEAQKDEEVIAYVKKFKKQWLYTFLLLTAALVPALFFRRFSVVVKAVPARR
jgi:CO/xanthine dehydrogenase FAD-binding subunit